MARKRPVKRAKRSSRVNSESRISDVNPRENDGISSIFRDMVPDSLQGTDQFLDIITWNIKWFNLQDESRIRIISGVLSELNADIFIFQEIEHGAMEPVAENLRNVGAGFYKTFYGTTGGDQRVVLMYDTQTVRATINPEELFVDDPTVSGSRKKVFPRRPIHSTITVRNAGEDPFDFHLAGVHLKSQRRDRQGDDGTAQRTEAARFLAEWLTNETEDEDIIVAGDWNARANEPEFRPIRELEEEGSAKFESFNPDNEASHFFKNGRSSRLDYIVVSASAAEASSAPQSKVIEWNALLDERRDIRSVLDEIVDPVSDHLPVVARFYFHDVD